MVHRTALFWLFFSAWLLMQLLNYYFSWFSLPDMLFITACTIFFEFPKQSLWRYLLPVSLLADLSATTPLGFHSLLYCLDLLILFNFFGYWLNLSTAGRMTMIVLASGFVQFWRCLLLFIITGTQAPGGWFWAIPMQFFIWSILYSLIHRLIKKDER